MGYNRAKKKMKKCLFLMLFAFSSIFASAVPSGCYDGKFAGKSIECGIYVSGNTITVKNFKGEELGTWTITSEDSDGNFTAVSQYGAKQSGYWKREGGKVYLYFSYQTRTRE